MFLYKPQMETTCCPSYTIRLDVQSFNASKEQRRVLRRFQRYLDGTYNVPLTVGQLHGDINGDVERLFGLESQDAHSSISRAPEKIDKALNNGEGFDTREATKCKDRGNFTEIDDVASDISSAIEEAIKSCTTSSELPVGMEVPKIVVQRLWPSMKRRLKDLPGDLEYTSNVSFGIAARLEHMHVHKKLKNGATECSQQLDLHRESMQVPSAVVVAELLSSKMQNAEGLHGLKVEACKGHLNFLLVKRSFDEVENHSEVFSRPNTTGVESENHGRTKFGGGTCLSTTKTSQLSGVIAGPVPQKHKLEIRMRRSAFDPEEFYLYKRYQTAIHNDNPEDIKESSYRRFLVDSPLIFLAPSFKDATSPCGFGSFHQQYLVDGRLIAVGVVDVLPSCLSSMYFFWDPDYAFLSLGKYSALREIMWVQEARKQCPTLEYYYLGYYIHSCPKMWYKAAYAPSELLCPLRYQWVPFDISHPLLDKQPLVCLSDHLGEKTELDISADLKSMQRDSSCQVDIGWPNSELEPSFLFQVMEVASNSKESQDVSNILLKLRGRYLKFKDLKALEIAPQEHMDALVHHLYKYLQVVGPDLAGRMAYVLC
eukprot:c27566_g1_i3 orf=299-2086(-)